MCKNTLVFQAMFLRDLLGLFSKEKWNDTFILVCPASDVIKEGNHLETIYFLVDVFFIETIKRSVEKMVEQ